MAYEITIRYNLTPTGQKAAIAAGMSGDWEREAALRSADAPDLALRALAFADVDEEGNATLDLRGFDYPNWDVIPSCADLVNECAACRAEKKAADDKSRAKDYRERAEITLRQIAEAERASCERAIKAEMDARSLEAAAAKSAQHAENLRELADRD